MVIPNTNDHWLSEFCEQQQLPSSYSAMAQQYLLPLAEELAAKTAEQKPFLVGINGCQGSGKSTLAALLSSYLQHYHHKNVANLSIDDFYLTLDERKTLAAEVHPLFITRGVPGTHDITLLQQTLDNLKQPSGSVAIPRFNKASDDRYDKTEWDEIQPPVDVVILEGWCVGVTPENLSTLATPINPLEAQEDPQGIWRNHVNQTIAREYVPLFAQLHQLIMLNAPDFNCVYQWRQLQEDKLRQKTQQATSGIMDKPALQRFIHHYQRLTQHMLQELPERADVVLTLNHQHQITNRCNNIIEGAIS